MVTQWSPGVRTRPGNGAFIQSVQSAGPFDPDRDGTKPTVGRGSDRIPRAPMLPATATSATIDAAWATTNGWGPAQPALGAALMIVRDDTCALGPRDAWVRLRAGCGEDGALGGCGGFGACPVGADSGRDFEPVGAGGEATARPGGPRDVRGGDRVTGGCRGGRFPDGVAGRARRDAPADGNCRRKRRRAGRRYPGRGGGG
jgi:hypothetical protein